METAIVVVWWIGLLGALAATAIILREAVLVIEALRHILALSERTARAAEGLARNLSAAARLRELHAPASRMRVGATSLRNATEELRESDGGEGRNASERGGR